jgi:hypothetical protein
MGDAHGTASSNFVTGDIQGAKLIAERIAP